MSTKHSSPYPRPPVIEISPGVSRDCDSWRRSSLRYDLSADEQLAAAGDEDADLRLRTARRLQLAALRPKPIGAE